MQRHITDRVDFSKFGVPSWRIEQRFAPGVLIGNWSEERLNFPKDKYQHNSTHRTDFKGYGTVLPDVVLRRTAKLNSEGLSSDLMFRHHGKAYDNMMITLYDENYNGRWQEKKLPALRSWDSQTLGWLPERTDHPLKGPPTNFGLKQELAALRQARQKEIEHTDYETTYQGSFVDKPVESMRFARHGIPKHLSSSLLPSNKCNNDLHLRGKQSLRMPEVMPEEMTQISI